MDGEKKHECQFQRNELVKYNTSHTDGAVFRFIVYLLNSFDFL